MEYLKYTPDMAKDWKNAINASEGYLRKRVADYANNFINNDYVKQLNIDMFLNLSGNFKAAKDDKNFKI